MGQQKCYAKMMSTFNLVKNWILTSDLVIQDSNDKHIGGVHSFYDEKNNQYGFLYPEITGYFLSTLNFLNSIENNSKYIQLGKNSCDWLMSIHEQYGGIIQGISLDKSTINLVYSFDSAICATGILDYYKLTKEEKYLRFAKNLTSWISHEAMEDNGKIKPVQNLSDKLFFEDKKLWYKQPGCLHLKVAIPFLKLYELTGDQVAFSNAKKILDRYNEFQNDDGSISLHENESTIHLHSLCYALEGLMYGYHITQNKKYLEICEKCLLWCISKIEKDGGVKLWFNSSYQQAKTSYHTAQLIRLLIIFDKLKNEEFRKDIKKLYNFMLTLQNIDGSQYVKGGFYEENYKSIIGWKKRSRINSWSSFFALQASYWYENYDKISFENSIELIY